MLLDANVLLYARDASSPFHARASAWLTDQLNGAMRVGFPWPSLVAFLRIATHPRVFDRPLSAAEARQQVEEWLAPGVAWIPLPTASHARVLGELLSAHDLRGGVIADAHLAALAIEHGLVVCSADTDFARFDEVRWVDPLAA